MLKGVWQSVFKMHDLALGWNGFEVQHSRVEQIDANKTKRCLREGVDATIKNKNKI